MSEGPTENHYAALGIERTADARAIKKAYFALVRKFPPESHAEEFKRIRAAYEVLSDEAARERYDEQEKGFHEYEGNVAAALGEAEEAVLAGNEAAAQETLRKAITAAPEVLLLRERLAASLARARDHEGALATLDALVERSPETGRFHFLRAITLRALKRMPQAEEALRKARELCPDEAGIHAALVDLLVAEDRTDDALTELDEVAAKHEAGSPIGIGILLRRADVLAAGKRPVDMEAVVDRLVRITLAAKDPELAKHVATELGTPAARLFAMKYTARANRLLERCHELYPESPVLRPYPTKITIDAAALSPAAVKWLSEQEPGPTSPALRTDVPGSPLWGIAGVAAAALVSFVLLFGGSVRKGEVTAPPAPFMASADGALAITLLLLLAGGLAAYVGRVLHTRLTSPIRGITTLHPMYVVRASVERVELHPILCLDRFDGVHHGHNGVYSRTELRLGFDTEAFSLTFHDPKFAQAWLDALLASQQRVLELLAAGYLDTEQGVELVPPEVKAGAKAAPARRGWQARRRWGLVAAGTTVVLWAAAFVGDRRYADELAFGEAAIRDVVPAYDEYLRLHPDGRFADDARRARERRLERAAAVVALRVDDGERSGAVRELARALELAGTTRLPIALAVRANSADAESVAAERALNEVPVMLGATLARVGIAAGASVDRVKALPGATATGVAMDCAIESGAKVAEMRRVHLGCTVRVLVDGKEKGSVVAGIARGVNATSVAGDRALEAMCGQLLRQVATELGIAGADDGRRQGAVSRARSPYEN